MTTQYLHLSLDERIEIEKRIDHDESLRSIAAALGRAPSTISREVRRGRWRPSNENAAYTPYRDAALHAGELTAPQYRAGRAQNKADTRAARSHQPTRLSTDRAITRLVSKLRDGWTPEMIAGRARIDFPDTATMWMSHETIYRFIYAKENRHRRLYEYLPRGRKKRRKLHGRKVHSSKIPNRVSIHHRPPEVAARTVFGHWEGDSVLGMKSIGDGVHTEVGLDNDGEGDVRRLGRVCGGIVRECESPCLMDGHWDTFGGLSIYRRGLHESEDPAGDSSCTVITHSYASACRC